ncbi:hypothetical protein [Nonomuraea sp. KM90]|uniref:hypothetical protein n=1 Tax=Nonomuraea sp. KM90 TaxID=3457428 RepID=UPI003FCD1ECA
MALVAAGNSVLTVVYQLLSDSHAHFRDLVPTTTTPASTKDRRARSLASQFQALTGQKIVIRSGKAILIEPETA